MDTTIIGKEDKRLCGQSGTDDWLVKEESTRNGRHYVHSCGAQLRFISIQVGGGLTQVPIQGGYITPAFTLEPDTIVNVPFCPKCEYIPESLLHREPERQDVVVSPPPELRGFAKAWWTAPSIVRTTVALLTIVAILSGIGWVFWSIVNG